MSLFMTNGMIEPCDPLLLRQDCFRTLDQAFERPFVCITGGQGLGKTVLLSSYLHHQKLPTIWFTVRTMGEHYAHFYQMLCEGLASLEDKAVFDNELSLLESVSQLEQRLVIVLDCGKYQQLEPRLLDFWIRLIQYRSPHLTLVLISRSRLKLPFAKLKAQKKIYEWKSVDLFFTPAEIEAYFQLEGIHLKAEELQKIAFQTGGWALGISYLASMWMECSPEEKKQFPQLLDDLLVELFSEDNDPAAFKLLQEFTHLSVLHELKTEVVNVYLAEGESDRIWDELGAERFFLQRKEDFSYHILPVVRDFLYRRLLRTEGLRKVNDLHLKTGKIYEEQFQYYNAFAHSLAGGWYEEAARLMQFMMNFYTPERFLLLMDGSLESICPSISMSTFSMFLFRCVPMSILLSYVPSLKKAMEQIEKDGANQSLLNLQHRLGLILYYSGDVDEAKTLFGRSLEICEKLGNEEYAIVNVSLLAQCCRFLGELDEGVAFARRALARIELFGAYAGKMHTIWILSELLLEQGDLESAKPIIGELLKWVETYEDTTARMYGNFVKAKYTRLLSELDEALEWAQKGLQAAEAYSLLPDLGWACLELGCIYQAKQETEQAIKWLTKSAGYFRHYRYFHKITTDQLSELTDSANQKNPPEKYQNLALSSDTLLPSLSTPEKGLVLQMLGPLTIKRDGEEITIQRKSSLMLLLCLAVNYGKKLPKEQILESIFSGGDYSAQNNRFYVSLSALRKALEPGLRSGRDSMFILQTGELYTLNEVNFRIDLTEFELLMNLRNIPPYDRIANLLKAEKLFKGDLLEAYPFESFLDPARERARRLYDELLLELARFYWKKKNFQNGINYFDRLLERDEYAETTYWEYIQTLVDHDFLNNAKHVADKMRRCLEKELGIPVSNRLKVKYSRLI